MKITTKSIALLVAFSLLFASTASAKTATVQRDDEPSTTEKVVGALAVGAVAGLAYYALTRDDDHHRHDRRYDRRQDRRYDRRNDRRYDRRDYRRDHRRNYIAFSIGFNSFSIGSPYSRSHRQMQNYWHRQGNIRFMRVPYRYNPRYDRSFNAGYERGYWAGYIQGRNDALNRYQCMSQFNGYDSQLWGYNPGYGNYSNYSRAFHEAFSRGYMHAYYGRSYGHENFGFGFNVRF